MFRGIRARFTYANVAMTLAFVFAMTGGAYAASKIIITSTKQIKPSVLAQLRGKAGPAGATGAQGPAGPQGPAGANGKDGSPGANGTNGTAGENVTSTVVAKGDATCKEGGSKFTAGGKETFACNGAKGPEGNIKATLNPGATETGTFLALPEFKEEIKEEETSPGVKEVVSKEVVGTTEELANLSFAIPLATPIESSRTHYVTAEEIENRENQTGSKEAPKECPGTQAAPEAQEGNLCIYESKVASDPAGDVADAFVFRGNSAAGTRETSGTGTTGAELSSSPSTQTPASMAVGRLPPARY